MRASRAGASAPDPGSAPGPARSGGSSSCSAPTRRTRRTRNPPRRNCPPHRLTRSTRPLRRRSCQEEESDIRRHRPQRRPEEERWGCCWCCSQVLHCPRPPIDPGARSRPHRRNFYSSWRRRQGSEAGGAAAPSSPRSASPSPSMPWTGVFRRRRGPRARRRFLFSSFHDHDDDPALLLRLWWWWFCPGPDLGPNPPAPGVAGGGWHWPSSSRLAPDSAGAGVFGSSSIWKLMELLSRSGSSSFPGCS